MEPKWADLRACGLKLIELMEAHGDQPVPASVIAAHMRVTMQLMESMNDMFANMRALSTALLRDHSTDMETFQ
jgi:hypothetical protein